MRMLSYPFLHIDRKPQRIDEASDNRKQKPFDVVAEQLSAGAVKSQSVPVNNGVLRNPSLSVTNRPRGCDREREKNH